MRTHLLHLRVLACVGFALTAIWLAVATTDHIGEFVVRGRTVFASVAAWDGSASLTLRRYREPMEPTCYRGYMRSDEAYACQSTLFGGDPNTLGFGSRAFLGRTLADFWLAVPYWVLVPPWLAAIYFLCAHQRFQFGLRDLLVDSAVLAAAVATAVRVDTATLNAVLVFATAVLVWCVTLWLLGCGLEKRVQRLNKNGSGLFFTSAR